MSVTGGIGECAVRMELLLHKDLWLSTAESTHQHWQAFRHLHLAMYISAIGDPIFMAIGLCNWRVIGIRSVIAPPRSSTRDSRTSASTQRSGDPKDRHGRNEFLRRGPNWSIDRSAVGSLTGSFLRCHLLCMESVRPVDSHLAMHIQLELSGGGSVAIAKNSKWLLMSDLLNITNLNLLNWSLRKFFLQLI